jgi:serine/threonine protein kinase
MEMTLKRPFLQICGLEALHEMRIMHCDLKPGNILVYPDGHLSIADFGLSVSWLDPRYNNYPSHAFRGRRLAGTEGYMAPELVSALQDPNGPRRGNFGFAADIWSMGVIIAELGMRGRRLVWYEDEEERERWKDNYLSFSRVMVLSREKLMKRVRKYLQGDHAMLVERVRVVLEFTVQQRY